MLDDGLGPAVYDQLSAYMMPENVHLFDMGCMTLSRVSDVRDYDVIITVDAVDGTDEPVGTIVRYTPDEVAPRSFGSQSLHELRLSDLFEAACMLDYHAEGICLGMQVENLSPDHVVEGLTPAVLEALSNLVDCVLAELVALGCTIRVRETDEVVQPGFHHALV